MREDERFDELADLMGIPVEDRVPTPPSQEVKIERLIRLVAEGERAQRLLDETARSRAERSHAEGEALKAAGLLDDEVSR